MQENNNDYKRILVVDDEPYNLIGLKVILEAAGGGMNVKSLVDTATNGTEAIAMVKKAFYDSNFQYGLIFMDLSMPILDGFKATEKIRQY